MMFNYVCQLTEMGTLTDWQITALDMSANRSPVLVS